MPIMIDGGGELHYYNSATLEERLEEATTTPFLTAKHALQQITDCDRLSADEYKEKYGGGADSDPYVIAEKTIKNLENQNG